MFKFFFPISFVSILLLLSCRKNLSPHPSGPGPQLDTTSNYLVYAASDNGKLYAFDAKEGTIKWTFRLNSTTTLSTGILSSPALADSTLFIGSSDQNIYAIDAYTGTEKWHYPTNSTLGFFYSSPVVANGVVYVGGYEPRFYAINAKTGQLVWSRDFPREFESSATVKNNTVYVECNDGGLYALNAADGSTRWQFSSGVIYFGTSSPVVRNGVVYSLAQGIYSQATGYTNSGLFILDANTGGAVGGRIGYTFPFGFVYISCPTVDDSVVYVGGNNSKLYAIKSYYQGVDNKLWEYTTGNEIYSSPTFDDSCVYVGSDDGILYAVRKTSGTLKWKFFTQTYGGNRIVPSPVIANGVIFVGSDRGLFAIDAKTGNMKWHAAIDAYFESSPCVVTKNGTAIHSSISGMRD